MNSGPARYRPGAFPPQDLEWEMLVPQIGDAQRAVGQFDSLLRSIPNPDALLAPMRAREAVLSSRIEGTQTSLTEFLEFEADPYEGDEHQARLADVLEVRNYRLALEHATDLLDELPLCNRLVRQAHRILMQGVRGRDKEPGNFRRTPNWIGPPGSEIEEATYLPCETKDLDSALARWEQFLHEDFQDTLVQLALVHAEFEAIHPFLDGNGRVGRMILPLFMFSKGLISRPHLYLSEYLESNRDEYYERLLAVSRDGGWTSWCAFFVHAVGEQATRDRDRAQATLDLYEELKDAMPEMTRSPYGVRALDWVFTQPVFLAARFVEQSGIPGGSARRVLHALRGGGVLEELRPARGRRSALYAFPRLLSVSDQS